jgi:hypothetical protein
MRNPLVQLGVAVLFLFPAFAAPLAGQQPAPPGDRGVQVGVPDGAASGDGGASNRRRPTGPPAPAPRSADGRALLGGSAEQKGLWLPGPVIPNPLGLPPAAELPYKPWARALRADRQTHRLEPHARCKPSGGARVFLTPYGVEIVEAPEHQRVYVFDVGGPHTFRTIYTDGRTHPNVLEPTYYGHSIGWWEGDTLVVDTVGFNEAFWFDRSGMPHTEKLRTLERFTRVDMDTLRYELTIDDPGAYTAPFTGRVNLVRERETELFEFVCQQANYAHELMVGQGTSVDRSRTHIP